MMTRGRHIAGGIAVALGLLLLAAASWVYLVGCGPGLMTPTLPARNTPTVGPTPLPTFTPYTVPTLTPRPGVGLRVTCNAPAAVRLSDYRGGQEVASGDCTPDTPLQWPDLPRGIHDLYAYNEALDVELLQRVHLERAENEAAVEFPGVLVVIPVPAEATVSVEGQVFGGEARLTWEAASCPQALTVVVAAPGYVSETLSLEVEAGRLTRYTATLAVVPTLMPKPTSPPTAVPATRPTSPPQTTVPPPPPPTPTGEWTQERLQQLAYQMWQNFNAVRQQNGLPVVDYDESLQAQANEAARQFYVTNRGITPEEMDAIVAPGWAAYSSNNNPLQGGMCGIPADYDPSWDGTFVVGMGGGGSPSLPAEVKAIVYGWYGPYNGTCGTSVTLVLVARY